MEMITDPTKEIEKRIREIVKNQDTPPVSEPDAQELKEREAAAQAYATEDERHFVDYLMDCAKQSITAYKDIREMQAYCYDVYKENKPVNYAKKEAWQAQIVVPKPFTTVQYGSSAVKKAFTPKFLSISNVTNKNAGEFWQKVMENQLNENHARFVLRFTDATTMALATGISSEMIPRFVPGRGLEYVLVEPWKIHRDPDAMSRDNQSGIYWIHQEYLDWYVLKEGEKSGRYFDVGRCTETASNDSDPFLTKEAISARKEMIWERSAYRKMILTYEFWGTVLDSKGNLLLPTASYTVAGGRVIKLPKAPTAKTMRWPGQSFSPLPDLLRFGGRGLLEGVISVWEAMCNIQCLHQDYLLWIVNPMTEITAENLVDPMDTKTWPGKEFLVRESANGQQNVRTVQRRFITNEILANLQYLDQNYQGGSFVPAAVQGLPGYRKDITYRESAQNLDQALGVYSLMGENIEAGAIDALAAGCELIQLYAGYDFYKQIFTETELQTYGIQPDPESPNGVSGVPIFDGTFHVSGIQTLMRDAEALTNLQRLILPLLGNPRFAARLDPYAILLAIETRTNLKDEKIIVDEETNKLITAAENAAATKQAEAAQAAQDLAEAHGMTDLANKMDAGQPGTTGGENV